MWNHNTRLFLSISHVFLFCKLHNKITKNKKKARLKIEQYTGDANPQVNWEFDYIEFHFNLVLSKTTSLRLIMRRTVLGVRRLLQLYQRYMLKEGFFSSRIQHFPALTRQRPHGFFFRLQTLKEKRLKKRLLFQKSLKKPHIGFLYNITKHASLVCILPVPFLFLEYRRAR